MYRICITRRKGKFNQREEDRFWFDVEQLADIFKGISFKVFLLGGTGPAILQKTVSRYHKDFDLAIFHEHWEEINELMKKQGYKPYHRVFYTHLSPWHDLVILRRIRKEKISRETMEGKRIRFNIKSWKLVQDRLSLLELFFLKEENNGIQSITHNFHIPDQHFYPLSPYHENSGLFIPRDSHYDIMQADKSKRRQKNGSR